MTSFVIASLSKIRRTSYVAEYCKELGIDKFDTTLIEKDTQIKKNTQSIGIDEIKNLHKSIYLKPVHSENKAVIIEDADILTTEAQNALLKVLEEPPAFTIIILGVNSVESLIPTILSRCQIIELPQDVIGIAESEKSQLIDLFIGMQKMGVGDRLKKAEELSKDKDETVLLISKSILSLREKLLDQPDDAYILNVIKALQKLNSLLSNTNVNPRFAIETTLLSI